MKKMNSVKRFALVAMAFCLTTATFVACDDDDDPNTEDTKTLQDVNGSYTGKVTFDISGATVPVDVTATVKDGAVNFSALPVADLVGLILSEQPELASSVKEQLKDGIAYSIKYTAAYDDATQKTAIELTLTPEPLSVQFNTPVPNIGDVPSTVTVSIKTDKAGTYTYASNKLAFDLSIDNVTLTVGGVDTPVELTAGLSFDLTKDAAK
ncbi:MAG: DUF4840 domain-containing protein [Prevotellaceae bacterium]|jgi:hypothetical protein|nr:DUF4840 domain-containing protein [Prevotellaceae bacterium]